MISAEKRMENIFEDMYSKTYAEWYLEITADISEGVRGFLARIQTEDTECFACGHGETIEEAIHKALDQFEKLLPGYLEENKEEIERVRNNIEL